MGTNADWADSDHDGADSVGSRQRSVLVGWVILATVATVFPGFLVGALSVQVSEEFDVAEATYGWGLGGFFLAATCGSILFGRLVQHIGPRRQMTGALIISSAVQLALVATANSFWTMVVFLGAAGLVNAANQTAVNLALTQAELPRLGLAIAFKQSAMPAASMLSGAAVPALALTVGWRWAYGLGAVLSLVAAVGVWSVVVPRVETTSVAETRAKPLSSLGALITAAVATGFLAFGAGALNAWLVGSAVDAGLGRGAAGWLLSAGAALGIAMRLIIGFRLDTLRIAPFRLAAALVLIGALGMALLSPRSITTTLIASVLAFVGGWTWPVLTNFGIVRANAAAAGAATGITQTGVYVGVFTSPLVTGWLIERFSYSAMWLVVGASMLIGAAISFAVANDFAHPDQPQR